MSQQITLSSRIRQFYARYIMAYSQSASSSSSTSSASTSPSSSSTPSNFTTQILKCDPESITFPPSSSSSSSIDASPHITCPTTLQALHTAAHHLASLSNVVVFPTETVYGLGAPALSSIASSKIFSTKGRPPDNPLIVHVSSMRMLSSLLPASFQIPQSYEILIRKFWPGALTLLFPRNEAVIPEIITAGQKTVGSGCLRTPLRGHSLRLRIPRSPRRPSATRAEHVMRDLAGRVAVILDGGACGVGLESTVVDGLGEDGHLRVLRPGGITVEDLERALEEGMEGGNVGDDGTTRRVRVLVHKRDYRDEKLESAPTTPGMKYRHYSPSVPVVLLETIERTGEEEGEREDADAYLKSLRRDPIEEVESGSGSGTGVAASPGSSTTKIGIMAPSRSKIWNVLPEHCGIEWVRYDLGEDNALVAQRLFDGLLSLEHGGVQSILVEEVDEEREGLAVMNRVRKAASSTIRLDI
ncbi:DHBP synthase RibB-like alpha/beta domain-containing protein [Panaeolus papilionaceus]|nr:DHBP synthase RibB-like alpha/beta domain-containing protein [Panaeolus papilionaceus]